MLLNMLERIDDKRFLKLIWRWLKAGILDIDGQVLHPETGTRVALCRLYLPTFIYTMCWMYGLM